MENYKKKIGNSYENDIKSIKTNNTKMNNPQEIANTFSGYFLTITDTNIRNIKKGNIDPRDNVDPSNYLLNNFNSTFSRINWN